MTTRRCERCALLYNINPGMRFIRWFLNSTWEQFDSMYCPSTYCRGAR